jgi:hypothetical protein
MHKQIEAFVKAMAQQEAENQLSEIEDNFINTDYFEVRPHDEASLKSCFQALVDAEDEPWWYCWQMVSDEIPDMLAAGEDLELTRSQAKILVKTTYEAAVLAGLKRYFEL